MAFYNAFCCEPAFADQYEQLQDSSLQLSEAPHDSALFTVWQKHLASWRSRLLVAYAALVPPALWNDYASKYHRTIPKDLTSVHAAVEDVWRRFPDPSHRRERLDALTKLL
ncbi:hypothetical protein PINS_up003797 [Pythium insidiosum]|nr:hypothetical protein PINS_up003797 [Pythium insidiosum]